MNPEQQKGLELQLLAVRCQVGEAEAFDELVQRFHLPLWKYLRRLTADPAVADELVQEVWLKVIRGFPDLRDPARLAPWMFRIARFTAIDRLRRGSMDSESPLPTEIEASSEPEPLEREERDAVLHQGLAELPWVEREVLTLFYLEELSLQEVAEVLEVPKGTVKSRLHRARRLLKMRLEHKGIHS